MIQFPEFYTEGGETVDINGLLCSNPEVIASHAAFNDARLNLYDWLEAKSLELPPTYSLVSKAAYYVGIAAIAFSVSSLEFKKATQDQDLTKQYIAQTLVTDSTERTQRFGDIVIDPRIKSVVPKTARSLAHKYTSRARIDFQLGNALSDKYFSIVRRDVSFLLQGMQMMREGRIRYMATEMPLTSQESVHFEPDPYTLEKISIKNSSLILKNVLSQ